MEKKIIEHMIKTREALILLHNYERPELIVELNVLKQVLEQADLHRGGMYEKSQASGLYDQMTTN